MKIVGQRRKKKNKEGREMNIIRRKAKRNQEVGKKKRLGKKRHTGKMKPKR